MFTGLFVASCGQVSDDHFFKLLHAQDARAVSWSQMGIKSREDDDVFVFS